MTDEVRLQIPWILWFSWGIDYLSLFSLSLASKALLFFRHFSFSADNVLFLEAMPFRDLHYNWNMTLTFMELYILKKGYQKTTFVLGAIQIESKDHYNIQKIQLTEVMVAIIWNQGSMMKQFYKFKVAQCLVSAIFRCIIL